MSDAPPPVAGVPRQHQEEKDEVGTRGDGRGESEGFGTALQNEVSVSTAKRFERIARAAADDITIGDIRAREAVANRVLQAIDESRQRDGYDAEAEGAKVFAGLLKPDEAMNRREQAMAFLKLWANSYLLKGNLWDIPRTMGAALNHVVTILEDDLYEGRRPDGDGPSSREPTTKDAGQSAAKVGSAESLSVAGSESQPTLSNNRQDDATATNDSTDLPSVREGLSGDGVRGEAGPSADVRPVVRERPEAADAGRVESAAPTQATHDSPTQGSGAGHSDQGRQAWGDSAEALRGMRSDDRGRASRQLRRTAERPLVLSETSSRTGAGTESGPDQMTEPSDSLQSLTGAACLVEPQQNELVIWRCDSCGALYQQSVYSCSRCGKADTHRMFARYCDESACLVEPHRRDEGKGDDGND